MKIFEYIRTTFDVIKAFITQDALIYAGVVVLAFLVLWSIFAIIFAHERRLARVMTKVLNFIKANGVKAENYFEFTALLSKLPRTACRKWEKFEKLKTGVPSDYITFEDCLETPVTGGIQKQSRSLMKFVLSAVTLIFLMLSFAITSMDNGFNLGLLVEASLVPAMFYLVGRINYFIYTAIRHNEYKMTAIEFNDFVDILDRNVDFGVFEGKEDELLLRSNIYHNELEAKFFSNQRKQLEKLKRETRDLEEKIGNSSIAVKNKDILQDSNKLTVSNPESQKRKDVNKDILKTSKFFETGSKIEINNQKDFENALQVVERLLASEEEFKEFIAQDEKSQKVNELMEAMNKYRNNKL